MDAVHDAGAIRRPGSLGVVMAGKTTPGSQQDGASLANGQKRKKKANKSNPRVKNAIERVGAGRRLVERALASLDQY